MIIQSFFLQHVQIPCKANCQHACSGRGNVGPIYIMNLPLKLLIDNVANKLQINERHATDLQIRDGGGGVHDIIL